MTAKNTIVIIFAGLACALAVLSAGRVGAGALPLLLIGSFPIYVASLSFGTTAGVGASIVAILVAGVFGEVQSAMVIGLAYSIPASIIGHQANLGQQLEDGSMEWFPLPQLFFNLCILVTLGIVLLGVIVGYDTSLLSAQMNGAVEEVLKQNPQPTPMSSAEIAELSNGVIRIMPFVFSGIWLITHVVNLYFAAMVSRASGLMPRPKEDIPATADLSKPAIFILLISIVCASFLTGAVQLFAGVVAGVFIMAFALLGLANMHFKARGNPAGMLFIIIAYVMIIIVYLPIYLFAVTGVLRNINGIKQSNPPSGGK